MILFEEKNSAFRRLLTNIFQYKYDDKQYLALLMGTSVNDLDLHQRQQFEKTTNSVHTFSRECLIKVCHDTQLH